MPPPGDQPEDQPNAVLVYQVRQLEKQLGNGLRHVDERLDRLEGEMRASLAALTFVNEKAYLADRSADQRISEVRESAVDRAIADNLKVAENARAVAWAAATMLIAVTVMLLGIIKAVAG